MHDIEPYYKWRNNYVAAEDGNSPFFGRTYSEFTFSQKVYNYYIHPQWDDFGSNTLYMKVLYVDYHEGYAIIELIGEWNDALYNDVEALKREIVDKMIRQDISKFIIMCDNVLNFHGSDDCYYEEWWDDVKDEEGWICFLNTLDHVREEMDDTRIQYYVNYGPSFNDVNWRLKSPGMTIRLVEELMDQSVRSLN